MNRREFLRKAVGAAGLVGMTLLAPPELRAGADFLPSQATTSLKAFGRVFEGTSNGHLLESLDDGRSWVKIADFGSACSIQAMLERQGVLYLQIGLRQYCFFLKSADARRWHTTDWIPAA